MALPMLHSYSRNISRDSILSGHYSNIRIHGLLGNMNPFQPWATLKDALARTSTGSDAGNNSDTSSFMHFSASCYYFGESLSDHLAAKSTAAGTEATPIGLIHTAWGGSTIEQWLSRDAIATCGGAAVSPVNSEWHESRVLPYVGMSVKGFTW